MTYENKQTYDNRRDDYSEAAALQDLMRATDAEASVELERMAAGKYDSSGFTINIGGKSIAFNLGGPQLEALNAFIRHICAENAYEEDFDKLTVDGWY